MAYIIDQLTYFATIIGIILFFVCIALFTYIFLSKKKRKVKLSQITTDYSHLNRKDVLDYIKFDDIRNDMIITDHGTRFIGVIKCYGINLNAESAANRLGIYNGFYGFINTINKPISYRQYSKPVDLDHTIERYQNAYNTILEKLYNTINDIKELQSNLKLAGDTISANDRILYQQTIEEKERLATAYKFRKFHLEDQIRTLNMNNGQMISPDTVESWVFEWKYDSFEFSVELSNEEIEKRAINELEAMAQAKIHALNNCGVSAFRCNTEDLIEMFRCYSSPISATRYKAKNIEDSNFFDGLVTSNSKEELKKEALEEMQYKMNMKQADYIQEVTDSLQVEAAKLMSEYRKEPSKEKTIQEDSNKKSDSIECLKQNISREKKTEVIKEMGKEKKQTILLAQTMNNQSKRPVKNYAIKKEVDMDEAISR